MADALKEVLAHLSGTRDATQPSLARFPDLIPKQIVEDLAIERRARAAGEKCLPHPDTTSLDGVEHEIVDFIEARGRKSQHEYQSALTTYQIRINDSSVSDEWSLRFEAAGESMMAKFKAEAKKDEAYLFEPVANLREIEKEYRQFQLRNRLTDRQPIIRSSNALTTMWLIVGILWLLESAFNGLYFAQGSTSGIIGGVSVAVTFALFNIGLAAVQGLYALKYCSHRHWPKRIMATFATVTLLVVAVFLNGFIAEFRDIYVVTEGAPPVAQVLARLSPSKFSLQDANSILLFMLGLFLHFGAVFDFFLMNDPYPGYSKQGANRKAAINGYVKAQEYCIQGLTQHMDDAIADMQKVIELLGQKHADYQLATEFRVRLHRDYAIHLEHLGKVGLRLLETYRAANRDARPGGCSTPASFATLPKITIPELFELPPIPRHSAEAQQRAVDTMRGYIQRIPKECEAMIARLKGMGDISDPGARDANA